MCSRPSTRAVAIVVAALALLGGFAAPAAGASLSDGDPSLGSASDDVDASLTDAVVNETSLDGSSDGDANDSLDDDTAGSDGLLDSTETDDGADGAETDLGDEIENTTDSLEDATNETTDSLEETTGDVTEPLEDTANETTDLETSTEDRESTLGSTELGNATLNASAGLESGESGTGANDRGSAADGSSGSSKATSTGGSDSNAQSDAGSPPTPSNGSTATDAVLVGLMGTITASGAAAAGASGAGAGTGTGAGAGLGGTASNLAANWLHPAQSRWLRRLCSLAPAELLSVLGYSRYDDSDPLENDRREAIYDMIRAEPGCYLSEVGDRQDVSLSTVRHHARILEEEGLIASVAVDGKRRYFTVEDERDAALHAALAEPAKREVLEALANLGPVNNGRLADELERDPSTVSHHLSALEDDGLVVRERDGRAVVNDLTADAEAAVRGETGALEEADEPRPSAPSPADD
ncbi:winged helix-turn-helix transcriptional regulator [Halopiger thermotolerans]